MPKKENFHHLQAFSLVFNDRKSLQSRLVDVSFTNQRINLPELHRADSKGWVPTDLNITDINEPLNLVCTLKSTLWEPRSVLACPTTIDTFIDINSSMICHSAENTDTGWGHLYSEYLDGALLKATFAAVITHIVVSISNSDLGGRCLLFALYNTQAIYWP